MIDLCIGTGLTPFELGLAGPLGQVWGDQRCALTHTTTIPLAYTAGLASSELGGPEAPTARGHCGRTSYKWSVSHIANTATTLATHCQHGPAPATTACSSLLICSSPCSTCAQQQVIQEGTPVSAACPARCANRRGCIAAPRNECDMAVLHSGLPHSATAWQMAGPVVCEYTLTFPPVKRHCVGALVTAPLS